MTEEVSAVAKQLNSGKDSGLDGLPIESYRSFWHIVGEGFTQIAHEVLNLGTLYRSQRTGVIRLFIQELEM